MIKRFLVFLLIIILTSCAFHLRGPFKLAPPLHRLYLKTTDPYGQLARNLTQSLELSNVELVSTPEAADTILSISETQTSQLLSVGGAQQTRQYNLILTVKFDVTTPQGKMLIYPQEVSETRTLTIQSDQMLGGSNQANALYQQMRQAIVFAIMLRLSSEEVSHLLVKKLNETTVSTTRKSFN